MPEFDQSKRDFLKMSIMGLGIFMLNFSKMGNVAMAKSFIIDPSVGEDEFGVLYSQQTGIILRTINPGPGEQKHLNWLELNKPHGTSLLRIKKRAVGADHYNVPNVDMLIPYIRQHHRIILCEGKTYHVVDGGKNILHTVVCCPVLFQRQLRIEHTLIPALIPGRIL